LHGGGEVPAHFADDYKAATAAGFVDIEAYWFPCSGSTYKCKSYSDQITALTKAISDGGMKIGRIWLDIEKSGECKNWDYGSTKNLAEAKDMLSALKSAAGSIKTGIYSSSGEWGQVFGSSTVVLDSDQALWFADYDNKDTLTIPHKFGGWTKAVGKQYANHSSFAGSSFDLSVFES
jgi:hypothetical protein